MKIALAMFLNFSTQKRFSNEVRHYFILYSTLEKHYFASLKLL